MGKIVVLFNFSPFQRPSTAPDPSPHPLLLSTWGGRGQVRNFVAPQSKGLMRKGNPVRNNVTPAQLCYATYRVVCVLTTGHFGTFLSFFRVKSRAKRGLVTVLERSLDVRTRNHGSHFPSPPPWVRGAWGNVLWTTYRDEENLCEDPCRPGE